MRAGEELEGVDVTLSKDSVTVNHDTSLSMTDILRVTSITGPMHPDQDVIGGAHGFLNGDTGV